jgi:SAM-dependent methyltransferase
MYTGERILPTKMFNVTYQQSLVAYEFAAQYAKGKSVLDVASGEGYGTHVLGLVAQEAVGLDAHRLAVATATQKYGSEQILFIQADLRNASSVLGGKTFDVVCCFQTIEHVQDHDEFLNALFQVTKPGGVILVSTPNTDMFHSFNPYHVHEVNFTEIDALFRRHCREYTIYGVFGDESVIAYRTSKQRVGDKVLQLDFLHARNWLPGPILRALYAFVSFFIIKRSSFKKHSEEINRITTKNFSVSEQNAEHSLDFIVVAKKV